MGPFEYWSVVHDSATEQVPLIRLNDRPKADPVSHGVRESHRSLTIGEGLVTNMLAHTLPSIAEVMEGRPSKG